MAFNYLVWVFLILKIAYFIFLLALLEYFRSLGEVLNIVSWGNISEIFENFTFLLEINTLANKMSSAS